MGYLYFNYQYLLFMLPAIALSMIAQIMVKSAFSRYSKVLNRRGLTGAMAAEQVLWANQVPGVRFEHIGESSGAVLPDAAGFAASRTAVCTQLSPNRLAPVRMSLTFPL